MWSSVGRHIGKLFKMTKLREQVCLGMPTYSSAATGIVNCEAVARSTLPLAQQAEVKQGHARPAVPKKLTRYIVLV